MSSKDEVPPLDVAKFWDKIENYEKAADEDIHKLVCLLQGEDFEALIQKDPSLLNAKNPQESYTLIEFLCKQDICEHVACMVEHLIKKGAKITPQCYENVIYEEYKIGHVDMLGVLMSYDDDDNFPNEINGEKTLDLLADCASRGPCNVPYEYFGWVFLKHLFDPAGRMSSKVKLGVSFDTDGHLQDTAEGFGYKLVDGKFVEKKGNDDDEKEDEKDSATKTEMPSKSPKSKNTTGTVDKKKQTKKTKTPSPRSVTAAPSNAPAATNKTTMNTPPATTDGDSIGCLVQGCKQSFSSANALWTHMCETKGKAHKRYRTENLHGGLEDCERQVKKIRTK